jgi:site-specific DNA-methyltransferase (adenine-specific)
LIELKCGDCFELFKGIEDKSIDLVLCDPPYGITNCKWDSMLDLDQMWKEVKRVTKKNGCVVFTAIQPFTSELVVSNKWWYKYNWVWNKGKCGNPLIAKYQPLRYHEDILVFYRGACPYRPQGLVDIVPFERTQKRGPRITRLRGTKRDIQTQTNYPRSILNIPQIGSSKAVHPTQKPVSLMEYLIMTYSDEGHTVLDFCMGSGTAAVAAKKTKRNFIGFELSQKYYEMACLRVEDPFELSEPIYQPERHKTRTKEIVKSSSG